MGPAKYRPNTFPAKLRPSVEPLETRRLLSSTFTDAGATAMVYDPSGNLYVALYNTQTSTLQYAFQTMTGYWLSPMTLDPSPQVGSSLAIAVNSQGQPGVAYYDAKKGDLKYAQITNGEWNITVVDSAGSVGQNPSLVFDQSDHPLISYFSKSGGDLKLAKFDGTQWTKTTIDKKGAAGQFSSIAINPTDDTWAIAYGETTKRQVKYATQSGLRTTLTTSGKAKNWSTDVSLAFNSTGMPAVSFYDPAAKSLKLASFDGSWATQTLVSGNVGSASTLSFDPVSGAPQVVYVDRASGTINLTTNTGGNWSTDTIGNGNNAVVARNRLTNGFSVIANGGSGNSIDTPLAAPSALSASVNSSNHVDLTWADNSDIETGFVIERSSDQGATFTHVATVGPNVTSYSDTSAGDGVTYIYRVKAVDLASNSSFAISNSVSTNLNAPTGLTATALSNGTVHLQWVDSSVGAVAFAIQKSTAGVTFTTIAGVPATLRQFDDNQALADATLYYRVAALNDSGTGPASAMVLVHTAPAAPTGLRVFGEGTAMFELEWSPVTGSATHILIQSRLAGTTIPFSTIDTVTADQFSDMLSVGPDGNALSPNTAYEFRLISVNVDGIQSLESVHASGSTGLTAPGNVTARAESATFAVMHWDPNSGAATHYNVYLSTDGNVYTLYSPTFQQASTLVLNDLSPATHYWLKVTATDGTNESPGTIAQVTTPAATPGAAPVNVSAQISEDNPLELSISWTNVASDAIGFHIQRSTDGNNYTTIEDVPYTWNSYDDPSVVEGTYYYRIQTFTAYGDAGTSTVAWAATYLANPINLRATATTAGQIDLTWTNTSTLTSFYKLYAADSEGNPILVNAAVSSSATSYAVSHFADGTLLTPGATYSFYLVPFGLLDALGSSQWATAVNGFAAPPEIDVTATAAGQLTISWTDVSNETGYQIESSSDGIHYTLVGTVGANITSLTQSGLTETTSLYYRVKALGNSGDSAFVTSTLTSVSPIAPSNLVVTPLTGGSFQLTWSDNSSTEDGYSVSFTTDNGDVFIPAQLPAGATSCVITESDLSGMGLPGRKFAVKVTAFRWQSGISPAAEVDNIEAI